MTLSTLGRRYERLLLFAAPFSFATLLILFVAFATETQKERSTARCYESAASLLETKYELANSAWVNFVLNKKSALAKIEYEFQLRKLLIDVTLGSSCYRPIIEEISQRTSGDLKALISGLQLDAKRLFTTPIKYPGVEIPEKATISIMGTSLSIDLTLFASLLQVVLAPLMLLWLGSLYRTRYSESLLIEKASSVTDVFPHLINMYPAVRYPEPKRRSFIQPYIKGWFAFIYACIRIGLLSIFIVPVTTAYLTSMILLNSSSYFALFVCLGILVTLFAASLVLCEFLPWHFKKIALYQLFITAMLVLSWHQNPSRVITKTLRNPQKSAI